MAEQPRMPAPQPAPEGLHPALVNGIPVNRQNRKPFGNFEQKLAAPVREGYKRHWFNDEPGRIQRALEAGYTHVIDPLTKNPVNRVVGRADSVPIVGFLMEIPQEWYDDDMAVYQKIIDEKEAGIKRGVVETNGKDSPQVFRAEAQGRRIQIQTPRRS